MQDLQKIERLATNELQLGCLFCRKFVKIFLKTEIKLICQF